MSLKYQARSKWREYQVQGTLGCKGVHAADWDRLQGDLCISGAQGSINTVIAIAAAEDLEAESVDVDTALIYDEVAEDIYMDQPDGFEYEVSPTKKCLLQKAL